MTKFERVHNSKKISHDNLRLEINSTGKGSICHKSEQVFFKPLTNKNISKTTKHLNEICRNALKGSQSKGSNLSNVCLY